jgi:hypothetical protein
VQSDSRRSFSITLWTGLIVVAVVLSSRRMSGHLSQTLSNLEACVAVTLAVVISLLAYVLFWSNDRSRREFQPLILVGVVTLVPPFALGFAMQPNPSTVAFSYLISLFFLSGMAIFLLGGMKITSPQSKIRGLHPTLPAQNGFIPVQNAQSDELKEAEVIRSEPVLQDDPLVTQWIKRSVSESHQEQIEGEISVVMTTGQKLATVHVPFVPPLSAKPEVECRGVTDSKIRLKVASINSYGIRIEIRRSGSIAIATSLRLGFTATTSALQSEAA